MRSVRYSSDYDEKIEKLMDNKIDGGPLENPCLSF
jgi:hypothetical protein